MQAIKTLSNITHKDDAMMFAKNNRQQLKKEKLAMPKNDIQLKMPDEMMITPSFDVNSLNLTNDEVFIVGNTVGFFDSHRDVSMRGSWTKTANERGKRIPIVKDHYYTIDNLFAENKECYVIDMTLRNLGLDMDGMTEVIAFKIKPYMDVDLEKYQTGTIKQHSMGLQYVNIELAVNNPEDEEGYRVWTRYYDTVLNKMDVDRYGYFWAVLEQKAIECSAVVFASNELTPGFAKPPIPKSRIIEPSTKDTQKQVRRQSQLEYLSNL